MAATIALTFLFSGCFTGIESTPKITERDLKRQNIVDTPDRHILDTITPQMPADWTIGKKFLATDSRLARAMRVLQPSEANLNGKILELTAIDYVPSLTGEELVELAFKSSDSTLARYPVNMTRDKWVSINVYDIPFMIDLDLVARIKSRLTGKSYYYKASRRFDAKGNDIEGLRYIPVTITDVEPGDSSRPVRVFFKDSDGQIASTLITLGHEKTSLRNFDTQFSSENPRNRYPRITDEVWDLIQHSRVRTGMTPDECRLALGTPDNYRKVPTTAGMVEYWSYNNGSFLTFEDGVLTRFRI